MKSSLRIITLSGIKISIHWTFLLLIGWVLVSTYQQTKDMNQAGLMALFILVVFFCIVLHELGHAFTGKAFGINTRSIVLLPIGGVAQMESLPEQPKQELLIAFAGPMVNLVIAGILYPIVHGQMAAPAPGEAFTIGRSNFLYLLFSTNLALALFNLIPAFPMDGGRVLRALLSFSTTRDRATAVSAFIGQIIAIAFVFIGLFFNPFLILIGLFIFLGARMEADFVHNGTLLHAYKIKDILLGKYYSLETTNTVNDAVEILLNVQAKDFLVIDHGKVKGTLSRDEIIKALSEKGGTTPVGDAMNREFISFKTDDEVDKIFREMQKGRQSIFPVFRNGDLAGAVDVDNIAELLLVNEARRIAEGRGIEK